MTDRVELDGVSYITVETAMREWRRGNPRFRERKDFRLEITHEQRYDLLVSASADDQFEIQQKGTFHDIPLVLVEATGRPVLVAPAARMGDRERFERLRLRLGLSQREIAFVAAVQVPFGAKLSEAIAAVLRMTDSEILREAARLP
jgi:hypothetical protein